MEKTSRTLRSQDLPVKSLKNNMLWLWTQGQHLSTTTMETSKEPFEIEHEGQYSNFKLKHYAVVDGIRRGNAEFSIRILMFLYT